MIDYLPGNKYFAQAVKCTSGAAMTSWFFEQPVPIVEGVQAIRRTMREPSMPNAALSAVWLGVPAQLDFGAFEDFNEAYAGSMAEILGPSVKIDRVARSNVAIPGLPEDSMLGFCTAGQVSSAGQELGRDFVVSGMAELINGIFADSHLVHGHAFSSEEASVQKKMVAILGQSDTRLRWAGEPPSDVANLRLFCHVKSVTYVRTALEEFGFAKSLRIVHQMALPPMAGAEIEIDMYRTSRELRVS